MKTEDKRMLTDKDVRGSALTWLFFHHCAQNYERMMGLAFAHTMSKPLEKLYKGNKEGLSKALSRHMGFFNTEPQLGSVIPGIALALEEKKAIDPSSVNEDVILSIKNALMGPLAGIGDSFLVGTLNPILLSIGIGLATDGSVLGPLFFMASWLAIVLPIKYFSFIKGYQLGERAVGYLADEKLKYQITTFLTLLGIFVIGGVAATTVKAPITLEFVSGEMKIVIQEIFDKILPNLLPLCITLVSYWLVSKKKWSANKLVLGILIFSAIAVALHVMG